MEKKPEQHGHTWVLCREPDTLAAAAVICSSPMAVVILAAEDSEILTLAPGRVVWQ